MNSPHCKDAGAFPQGSHWIVWFADWRGRRFGRVLGTVAAWARVTANAALASIVNTLVRIFLVIIVVVVVVAATAIVELAPAVSVSKRGNQRMNSIK